MYKINNSLRSSLLLGAATAAAISLSGVAYADNIETVTVTGSRIASADAISAAPISIVSADEILKTKTVTLEQILNKLPEMGQQGTNDQNSISPGGISTVDLRALGPNRTLILIDGQRMVDTFVNGFQGQDLSNVPVSMIDRIEVLKDGASPIYGADAIGGVINIITRKDFNGLQLTAGGGLSGHGDHFTKELSATLGLTSGKGGFLLGLEEYTEDPIQQSSRSWSTAIGGLNEYGVLYAISSASPGARYDRIGGPSGHLYGQNGGALTSTCPAEIQPTSCFFDTGEQPDIIQGREVLNANATAHYDFSDSIQAFADIYFTDRKAKAMLNPEPVGDIYTSAKWPGGLTIPKTNPNNTTGYALAIRKRLFEVGDRIFTDNADTYQVRTGVKGKVWSDWSWEAGYMFGESDGADFEQNAVNLTHIQELVGNAACEINAPAGCGSVTLAGRNSLTAAQVAYISYRSQNTSRYEQQVAYADLSGELPVTLQGGKIGVAVGVDWRREAVIAIPDSAKQSGDDSEGTTAVTEGSYSLKEAYGEAKFPLLKDAFLAQELSVDLAARFSHYSNFGNAGVYKGSVNWAVDDYLRFRADYGTGFRAPQVGGELYLGAEQSANGFTDPCVKATNATIIANCKSTGPLGVGAAYAPATFTQDVPQLTATQIGNPALKPETSKQYNVGVVLTPEFLVSNLAVTVDYYNIHLTNVITSVDPNTALGLCYESAGFSSSYCSLFGPRSVSGKQINTYFQRELNLGYTHTDGVDMGVTYNVSLPDIYGVIPNDTTFAIDSKATYMNNYITSGVGGLLNQYAGMWTVGAISAATPKWKAFLSGTFTLPSGFEFSWTERFVGETVDYLGADPSQSFYSPGDRVPALLFSDLSVTLPWDNYTAVFGVDNVFDKDPPLADDGYVQTISNQYDFVGRFFYLKLTAKL